MLSSALRNARYTFPSVPASARIMHMEQARPDRLVMTTFSLAPNVAPLSVERVVCSQVAAFTAGLGSAMTCQNATTLPRPSAVSVEPSTPDMLESAWGG